MQKGEDCAETGYVPVVVLTHPAPAKALDAAFEEIMKADIVSEAPVKLRML